MTKSKYKMVCIDMDGTLLGEKHKISDFNKKVLKEASDRGTHIVVTTGRLYNNAAYFSEFIGAKSAVIAGNGAVIREKYSEDVIYRSKINSEAIRKLFKIAKECKVILHMHTVDEIITNSYLSAFVGKVVLPCKELDDFNIRLKTIKSEESLEKWLKENEGVVTKCIAFRKTKKGLRKFRYRLKEVDGITFYLSGDSSIEINEKGVSKGRAVKVLGEKYGVKREEIICIGDNENDISMIEYAGLGIAMGNGIDKLKEKADYITDTNIKDGVGKAVKKFVLD
ncbi:MAG: Cof-type HAD-IIB family hydrolase [Clostridium sp.]